MAALIAASTVPPSYAGPVSSAAATTRSLTVAVRFATDRTHAPSGTVSDLGADQRELERLAGVLDASDSASTLLLVDPATRDWLTDFAGTPLADTAAGLSVRVDSRAHMDTVYGGARIDKLVASRVSQVADGILSWSSTPTVVYLPAAMDAKTDAFLAARPAVVSVLPAGSSTDGVGLAGRSPQGAPVVFRDAGLEACMDVALPTPCVQSAVTLSSVGHLIVVTPVSIEGPALREFLAAARLSPGVTLTSTLPSSKNSVAVAEVAVARKFPVQMREALVTALRQASALAALYPGDRSGVVIRQAIAAAVSDEVDLRADPLDVLASASASARKALDLVRVVTSDRFTVSGDTAEIPVTVLNDSEVTVSVTVALVPDSTNRLAAYSSEPLAIDPGTRATVPVTVRMTGTGTVGAAVGVRTDDGQAFGTPARLTITTTAYQEFARNIVWVAFALLVLLAGNNWRTRRSR